MLTVIAMGNLVRGVKFAKACLREKVSNIIVIELRAAACNRNFTSKCVVRFKAQLLHDSTFAVRINVGTATFRLCIHAEIGAVIV